MCNTGQKSGPDDNTIVVEISARHIPHSLVAAGDELIVTVGVTFNDAKIWVGCNKIIITDNITKPLVSGITLITI